MSTCRSKCKVRRGSHRAVDAALWFVFLVLSLTVPLLLVFLPRWLPRCGRLTAGWLARRWREWRARRPVNYREPVLPPVELAPRRVRARFAG
uniref:Uncharacterized protein n=1 Tax=uncultured Armatimonadetes bacterium TaxID=157466 RepID=A0A6J4J982_9BACT|nr:hypothetical protein AVDCRST_MAG63-3027 [uncultured Armatimonadetes bacterium]